MQLDRACLIQREQYPSIAGRPRIDAFPRLRQFRAAVPMPTRRTDLWEVVAATIASWPLRCIHRRANARGAIWLYGRGRDHRPCSSRYWRYVCDLISRARQWIVSDHQGQELKRLPAEELSRERMMALEVGAKRPHRQKSEHRG